MAMLQYAKDEEEGRNSMQIVELCKRYITRGKMLLQELTERERNAG
jgi:hypothetical protein